MNWKKIALSSCILFLFYHAPLIAQPSAEASAAIQKLIDKAEGKLVLDGIMGEDKIGAQKFTATEIRKNLLLRIKIKLRENGFTTTLTGAADSNITYGRPETAHPNMQNCGHLCLSLKMM